MSGEHHPDWDPRAPAALRDQRAAYDAMRERCPVAYSDFQEWSLFRHEDVVAVLADPETSNSASAHRAIPNGMDAPEHALYRRVLEPYFMPERMEAFEPRWREIAEDAVQASRARDEVEFVREFAEPFALKAECAFLGWAPDTWEYLRGWTHGNQGAALSRDRAAGVVLARELAGYVQEALRMRRAAGPEAGDDLTTRLMATEVEGKPLSDEDIVSILRNWIAGHGTVASALGILVLHVAEHADVQQRLRREPALLPATVDEILRVDGPLVANRRTATRAVAIKGGTSQKATS